MTKQTILAYKQEIDEIKKKITKLTYELEYKILDETMQCNTLIDVLYRQEDRCYKQIEEIQKNCKHENVKTTEEFRTHHCGYIAETITDTRYYCEDCEKSGWESL